MARDHEDTFPNDVRRRLLAAPALLAAGAVTQRWAWAADAAPKSGGVLKMAVTNDASSLNPCTGRIGTDQIYLWTIFDTLIDWDPATLEAKPGLAKAWTWADPKTLTLQLHEGVRFHDGDVLDAEAVKFNLEYMREHARSTVKPELDQIDRIEARDPQTVVIHLKAPDAALVLALSDRCGMMSSPRALREKGDAYDRSPVGTGGMMFVAWDDGARIVGKRNPDYWRKGLPYLDGIEFQIITDPTTGMRSVVAGQNDMTYRVPPQNVPTLKRTPNLTLVSDTTIMSQLLYLNSSRGPFKDQRVRQAFNHAIDREAYTRVLTSGMGEKADLLYPERHWSYDAQAAKRYPYDPDRARALIKEAGFPDGLKFELNHYSDQRYVQRVEVVAAMLEKANMFISKKNSGAILQINQSWREGTGDALMAIWTGRQDPSMAYSQMFLPTGYFNMGGVEHSPELTAAIYASRNTTDPQARIAALAEVQRLEREFALMVPLAFEPELVAHHNKVNGYVANLMGKPRFDGVWKAS